MILFLLLSQTEATSTDISAFDVGYNGSAILKPRDVGTLVAICWSPCIFAATNTWADNLTK